MPQPTPAAFLSYAISNDDHDYGKLTEFCQRLSQEVRAQTGDEFPIFQDRKDIQWGQPWEERLLNSIEEVTLLIPIITPSYFKRPWCRKELELFSEREKKLGRNDLILPVYYIEYPVLNDAAKRSQDPLAALIGSRQMADWRDLRFEPFTSATVGKTLAKMATQIRDALERAESVTSSPARPQPPKGEPAVAIKTDGATSGEQTQRGPSPKTEPPILVVDPLHRGNHPTVSEAIRAAKPGTRIMVRPGFYPEGLKIDKPLEIIGDGRREDIVIQATGKGAVLFKTTMGRIANLTLRQAGGGQWYGIDIAQGRLELEECAISSQSLACVAIHDGADPRLRNNRIHDGKSAGVLVYKNGQGTLEDNDIFGNTNAGVEIKSGGNPALRDNRIHDGKSAGVVVYENGQGTLEDNDIFGNTLAGVEIKSGGNPTLRNNRIHDGKSVGVIVFENGQGMLEGNDIFGNTNSGVEIKSGGNPTLRNNRIHDGKSSGVHVFDNGQGTLEGNDIFGNTNAGVSITSGGNPTLRNNRIHDGKVSGVHVYENGQGMLENNDIFGNASVGVEIKTGGNPTLRNNRINKNGYQAIWVHEGGGGTFEKNDLRGNTRGAWNIATDSESKVFRADNLE